VRRSYHTAYIYMIREIMVSFAIAFLFFFFVFFVNQLLLMAERILSKRVPLREVALLVFYSIPIIITYALPFGTLVGALMAVGRLSSDNEVMAFRALGVPLFHLLVPLLALGLALSVLAFSFNDFFLPLGNIRLKTMLKRIIFTNPGIELESYSVKRYDNTVIIMGEVAGNRISSPMIIDRTEENKKRVITARTAYLEPNPEQGGAVSLRLEHVFTHVSDPRNQGSYEYGSADTMVYNLLLKNISISMVNPGPAEKTSVDVFSTIKELRVRLQERRERREQNLLKLRLSLIEEARSALIAMDARGRLPQESRKALDQALSNLRNERARPVFDRKLQSYLLEFQRKFAAPLACFVFMVFAFPVGLLARRSGRSVGFAVGILMSGVYWGMLLVSYRLGSKMDFSPVLAMWLPNLVVFAAGIILIFRKARF